MFRLEKTVGGLRTSVAVDGELSAECVETVERCCDEVMSEGNPIDLLLRDVTVVDEAGRALLRRLAGKGVHLLGNDLYTSYLVRCIHQSLRS